MVLHTSPVTIHERTMITEKLRDISATQHQNDFPWNTDSIHNRPPHSCRNDLEDVLSESYYGPVGCSFGAIYVIKMLDRLRKVVVADGQADSERKLGMRKLN